MVMLTHGFLLYSLLIGRSDNFFDTTMTYTCKPIYTEVGVCIYLSSRCILFCFGLFGFQPQVCVNKSYPFTSYFLI